MAASFPKMIWKVRYLPPETSDTDAKERVTLTFFIMEGFMMDPLQSVLSTCVLDTAREHKHGFIAIATLDCNGLGPKETMEGLKFKELVDAIVNTLRNPQFRLGPQNRLVIVGYSLGGWIALLVAVSEQIGEWVGGFLMLAPALGCLLPFYVQKIVQLEEMGMTPLAEKAERGEVVRLGAGFPDDEQGFPLSYSFQHTSWPFMIGSPKLNLKKATFPVSIIIGDEDKRVGISQIQDLYERIPSGEKRMTRIGKMTHDFQSRSTYASVVYPELMRLAREAIPNIVNEEKDLMEGLNIKEWALTRTMGGGREYFHLSTGHSFKKKEAAIQHAKKLKDTNDEKGVCGPPTVETEMWGEGRTEVELINHQVHEFDLHPINFQPAQPEAMDEDID